MSWLARSLANSLRLEDDNDAFTHGGESNNVIPNRTNDTLSSSPAEDDSHHHLSLQHHHQFDQDSEPESSRSRGVKEDLTEFSQTLTRQFWGVASFLAPPPSSHPSSPSHRHQSDPSPSNSYHAGSPNRYSSGNEEGEEEVALDDEISGYHGEREEIEGRFRGEVSEFSRTGSNLMTYGSESEGNEEPGMEECDMDRAVGITEEVLTFAGNIAMHPETWLDFPIDEEDDTDDIDMSEAQVEHAFAIERLAPRLAALRIELCPCHMSESYFWKVYFVLLHSRLNKQDAEILSTPQVMAARALWMQELQKQTKPDSDWFRSSNSYSKETLRRDEFAPTLLDAYSEDVPPGARTYELPTLSMMTYHETEKHTVENCETHYIDKSVIEEKPVVKNENKDVLVGASYKNMVQDYEDDDNDWPEEDCELGGYSTAAISMVNEEDITFSDLEDDGYDTIPVKSKTESKGL